MSIAAALGAVLSGAPSARAFAPKPSVVLEWLQQEGTAVEVIACSPGAWCPYEVEQDFTILVPNPALGQLQSKIDALKADLQTLVASLDAAKAAGNTAQISSLQNQIKSKMSELADAEKAYDAQKVVVVGLGFAVVAEEPTAPCEGSVAAGTGLASTTQYAVMLPAQSAFDHCSVEVAADGTLRDRDGRVLTPAEQTLGGAVTWVEHVDKPESSATFSITLTKYVQHSSGTLEVEGKLRSFGTVHAPPLGSNAPRIAFSYAGLELVGPAAVTSAQVVVTPGFAAAGVRNHAAVIYAEASLTMASTQQVLRRSSILDVRLLASGESSAMTWRGDGKLGLAAETAEVSVTMPGTVGTSKGSLEVAIEKGAVATQTTTGDLGTAVLPAVGVPAKKPGKKRGIFAKAAATGEMPQRFELDVTVPKIKGAKRFRLRIGGGGGHRDPNP